MEVLAPFELLINFSLLLCSLVKEKEDPAHSLFFQKGRTKNWLHLLVADYKAPSPSSRS